MSSLGSNIKKLRKAKGLSMMELAALSQIDQALLSRYENDKRLPSEHHANKLAVALNQPVDSLNRLVKAEKIFKILETEYNPTELLTLAEDRLEYLTSPNVFQVDSLSDEITAKLPEVDLLKAKWQEKRPLSGLHLQKLEEYFATKYTYDSNRIEGNTLTFSETHMVVNEGLTIGGKSMREHLEAVNHSEAITWLKKMVEGSEDLTRRNVLDLHRLVLKTIDSLNAGVYRQVNVRIGGSEYNPPQPYLIGKLMEDYFIHYQSQKHRMHPVILAAEAHERLVSIHPFIDGNGRTSRLVMNFILLKNGYTVAILKGDNASRMAYFRALEEVQINNNSEPFYNLIADKTIESLKEHLEMV